MYPHERSLVRRTAGNSFAILGVNSDRDREALKTVLEDEEITWRSWWDGGNTQGPIATKWNVSSWPSIYVLDAEGVIRYKSVRGEALDNAIDTLLAEIGETAEPADSEEEPVAESGEKSDEKSDESAEE